MTEKLASESAASSGPEVIAERYEVVELLGRGGMACVHRVKDRNSGREVALKRLLPPQGTRERAMVAALFEREFHTLVQLRHPHVIAVYDYGLLEDHSAYYTMELLDGGDLRERAPLPWREVCRLGFEVCSSLALLHSRRLLHRDIGPRNIRCTRDGHAKLIDFGAMAAMGAGGGDVVGTPAFVAPETVQRLASDARTDLFSLGVTLYYALTESVPYPARTFADAMAAWANKVAPPSSWAADIPAALDDLTLALISIEPALRPQSAFEVMQRLAAIAGLKADESEAVTAAYLATPTLVGRDAALQNFRKKLLASRVSRSNALLISGGAGVGRSRFLDACVLDAKTLGFTALRATASGAREPFSTARRLTVHLLESLPNAELAAVPAELLAAQGAAAVSSKTEPANRPELKDFADPALDGEQLRNAICGLWLQVSRKRPLSITVDDVHRIDPASASVLAAMLDQAHRPGIFVALSADRDEPANAALTALARRCSSLELGPLTREQTHQLLGSVFGDVSNLEMLASEIHEVALGNPRQTMELARYLADRQVVRYAAGTWTLPRRLSADELPRSNAEAMRARIAAMPEVARFLAEAQALAFREILRDQDYRALLPQASSESIDRALFELLSLGILIDDGATYRIANRIWAMALRDGLTPEQVQLRHRALAAMYEASFRVAFIYHAFAGGLDERGHEALAALNAGYAVKLDLEQIFEQKVAKMMQCYPRAFESAERLGLSRRAVNELRRWHFASHATMENAAYPESGQLWRAQLEHDSGLDLYRADPDTSDPMQRLMRALQGAQERCLATPETERVYTVEEAIRLLAEYVVFGIAVGVRCHDAALLRSLPELLEPFVALSPLLDVIWNNARATYASRTQGDFEHARERWTHVLAKLDAMNETDLSYVKAIANAVAFGIGSMDAQLGLPSATHWADRLDQDPYQHVSALQLRRIVRLEQGDWKGAERLRRQAEVLSLQSRAPQMFNDLVTVELTACASAGDLAGVQEAVERLRSIAGRFPGWLPTLLHAEACFHRVRGDHEAAKHSCEQCIALTQFDADGFSSDVVMWVAAHCDLSEAWLALDNAEQARAVASHALERWQAQRGSGRTSELDRVLALAEAKLGLAGAVDRIEAVIAQQNRSGVTGSRLGLSYETRAQIAIWQRDAAAFECYAELTAREYRYGAESALGARYERLLNEAARHDLHTPHSLADFASTTTIDSSMLASANVKSVVLRTMARSSQSEERAQAALQLICASRRASSGHLYLTSPMGLMLSASQGEFAAPPVIADVREFLTCTREREEKLDEMATGDLPEAGALDSSIQVGKTRYALLVLSCIVDDERKIAGVAAIAAGDTLIDGLRQAQLLDVLASHLLEVGDSTAFGASTVTRVR